MRLIDADKAYDYLAKCKEESELKLQVLRGGRTNGKMFECGVAKGYQWSAMAIRDMPTIDAVPVVRCKDCIHGIDRQNLTMDGEWVTLYCPVLKCKRVGSMFCSEGRRKENDY